MTAVSLTSLESERKQTIQLPPRHVSGSGVLASYLPHRRGLLLNNSFVPEAVKGGPFTQVGTQIKQEN